MGYHRDRAFDIEARGFPETGDCAVCLACITDEHLKRRLDAKLSGPTCSFCGASASQGSPPIAANFEDFMFVAMEAIGVLYTWTYENTDATDWEGDRTYYGPSPRDASEIVSSVFDGAVTESVADRIVALIDNPNHTWIDRAITGRERDDQMMDQWGVFCDLVKHQSRFFFRLPGPATRPVTVSTSEPGTGADRPGPGPGDSVGEFLQWFSEFIERHEAELVKTVPARSEVYRARMVEALPIERGDDVAETLGSPPASKAAAGRMSPTGISMFYGAHDSETAVAEVAGHSDRTFAVAAKFRTVRDLTILDLTGEAVALPSLFETGAGEQFWETLFLSRFVGQISKPTRPDDKEHLDYVPTQVLTEFIRQLSGGRFDGLRFSSSRGPGICYTFFVSQDDCDEVGQEREWTRLSVDPLDVQAYELVSLPALSSDSSQDEAPARPDPGLLMPIDTPWRKPPTPGYKRVREVPDYDRISAADAEFEERLERFGCWSQ